MKRLRSMLSVLLPIGYLGGCVSVSAAAPPIDREEPVTAVYRCAAPKGTFPLVTRTRTGGMSVFLPPGYGEPYQILEEINPGVYATDLTRVVVGENSAELTTDEDSFPNCQYDRRASIWEHAKLNGVDFRGVGNEPGWVLEVRHKDRVDFEYDYGAASRSLPVVATSSDDAARSTRIIAVDEDDRLVVTLSAGPCADSMSDETFETRVTIEFGERLFRGCGRALH